MLTIMLIIGSFMTAKSMDVEFEFKGFEYSTNTVIKMSYPSCLVYVAQTNSEIQVYEKISIKMITKLTEEKPEFSMYVYTDKYWNICRMFPVNATGHVMTEKILCDKILEKPELYIHTSISSCFDADAYHFHIWRKRNKNGN